MRPGSTAVTLQTEHRRLTRRRLREGAREAFLAKPYQKVRIDDIVRAAGASRATFYLHYRSKRDVLDDLILQMRSQLNQHWLALAKLDQPTVDEIVPIVQRFIDAIDENRAAYMAWMEAGIVEPEMAEVNRADLQRVQSILYGDGPIGHQSKKMSNAEKLARTTWVVASLERFNFYWARLSLELDRRTVARLIAESWWHALFHPTLPSSGRTRRPGGQQRAPSP